MTERLRPEDRAELLRLARLAVEQAVAGEEPAALALDALSPALREPGAVFVTLTEGGNLRGCIGALEAYQPLAQDVVEHAAAAAVEDYRFSPVRGAELPLIHIEISRLTAPRPLSYATPGELAARLRPGRDGVVLRDGRKRATFLPQVWEKLPRPEDFLDQLCLKMGAARDAWRKKPLQVEVYEVEEFQED